MVRVDSAYALQRGHDHDTAQSRYGLTNQDLLQVDANTLDVFFKCSKEWHGLLKLEKSLMVTLQLPVVHHIPTVTDYNVQAQIDTSMEIIELNTTSLLTSSSHDIPSKHFPSKYMPIVALTLVWMGNLNLTLNLSLLAQ